MTKAKRYASLVVLMLVGLGCGGSSGFHTSVPGSQPLGTLSPADSKALCMDTANYVMAQVQSLNTKETQCRAVGLAFASFGASGTDAQIQMTCQAGYQLCLTAPADGGLTSGRADAGAPAIDCANTMTPGASCTATVAQYTACVNETTSSLQNAVPPCAQLTKAKLAMFTGDAGVGGQSSGPACTAFAAACPGVNVGAFTSPLGAKP